MRLFWWTSFPATATVCTVYAIISTFIEVPHCNEKWAPNHGQTKEDYHHNRTAGLVACGEYNRYPIIAKPEARQTIALLSQPCIFICIIMCVCP